MSRTYSGLLDLREVQCEVKVDGLHMLRHIDANGNIVLTNPHDQGIIKQISYQPDAVW